MPPPEERDLNQKAKLWDEFVTDKFGQQTFAKAKRIDVRWIWKRSLILQNVREPVTIDAEILVGQYVPEKSVLQLVGSNLYVRVYDCQESTDLKGRDTAYVIRGQLYKSTITLAE